MQAKHPWTNRPRPVRSRLLRAACTAAGVVAISLPVAACGSGSGGPGVAGAGSTTANAANRSPSGSTKTGALAYSRCMRTHGVPEFPDPNSNGEISVAGAPGSALDPNSPQWKAAQQACQSLMPGPSPAQQHQQRAGALKFAHCMRAHGIPMPDPPSQNGPTTQSNSSGGNTTGPDPNSPQFQAAQKACQRYAPGGGFAGSGSSHP
jgi:hypothetical protein